MEKKYMKFIEKIMLKWNLKTLIIKNNNSFNKRKWIIIKILI